MRTIPWPETDEEALNLLRDEPNLRTASWKQCSDEALQAIDNQLEAFGLEIVQFDYPGDQLVWKIEPRANQSRMRTSIEGRKST
jgi:hypothetical protein